MWLVVLLIPNKKESKCNYPKPTATTARVGQFGFQNSLPTLLPRTPTQDAKFLHAIRFPPFFEPRFPNAKPKMQNDNTDDEKREEGEQERRDVYNVKAKPMGMMR